MSESTNTAGKRPRLRGRDPRETPKFRPIADSNVELYVPASSKPVRVQNAHARRLFYYFAVPLTVFALMAGIGVWLYLVVASEDQLAGTSPRSGNSIKPAIALAKPVNDDPAADRNASGSSQAQRAVLIGAAPETGLPPLSPVSSAFRAAEACKVVRKFMEEDTLEDKLAWTSDPEGVKAMFERNFQTRDAREIQIRDLRCEKQFVRNRHTYLVVNATLFDFSRRDYIVQLSDSDSASLLVINDPASLLP